MSDGELDPLANDSMLIGTITIHYWMDGDGRPIITSTLPDVTEVSMPMQLAMLDLAHDEVLHPSG